MKRLFALLPLWALALAQGRLEAGLYAASSGPVPALEAGWALGEGEVFVRLALPRGALGYAGSLSLGPLGFLAYGLQGEVGEGGLGGAAFLEGGAGPLALEGRLGYRPQRAYPLFPEEGFFGRLFLRYRPAASGVVGLELARGTPPRPPSSGLQPGWPSWRLEGSYAFREGATYTLGAGLSGLPYALLGWKGEVGEEGEVLDLLLRLGGVNRLEAGLYLGEASLFLTLSYPWAGSLWAWLGDLGLEVGYEGAPYAWVRYAWRWP
uniref:Bioflim formation protein n=1 Tax=Thermus islandicus TaxID=540988 RepID=A0A7C2FXT0_9DEIN